MPGHLLVRDCLSGLAAGRLPNIAHIITHTFCYILQLYYFMYYNYRNCHVLKYYSPNWCYLYSDASLSVSLSKTRSIWGLS